MKHSFRCEIEPVGKGRPRASRRGNGIVLYTPKKTQDFESEIRGAFMLSTKEATPIFKADEALSVRLEFGISIPKSYTVKKREACLAGQIVPMKKPDIDNLVKAVLDALNGCMYEDDKQIIKVIAEKCYAGRPYVEVKCESDESKGEEVR